jgi:hypothetical protein
VVFTAGVDDGHFLVSQVSLEDTLQDENPKLDPITAVYMVGRRNAYLLGKKQKLKVTFPPINRLSETGQMYSTPQKCRTSGQLHCL